MTPLTRIRSQVNEGFIIVNRVVQPLLALMFGAAFIWFTWEGLVPQEAFVAVGTAVILWWFRTEEQQRQEARTEAQQAEMVQLAKEIPTQAPPPSQARM